MTHNKLPYQAKHLAFIRITSNILVRYHPQQSFCLFQELASNKLRIQVSVFEISDIMRKNNRSTTNKGKEIEASDGKPQFTRGTTGSLWRHPQRFVPAKTQVWSSLAIATIGSRQSQKSNSGDSLARSSSSGSGSAKRTLSSHGLGSSTFVLKYYTNNSVPANSSAWVHPPLPSINLDIKHDASTPDPRSWSTVPENAKWCALPSWSSSSPYVMESMWCTKKRSITMISPPARSNPWAAVTTDVPFPTPPPQENPNEVVANSVPWVALPKPVIKEASKVPTSWDDLIVPDLGPKEKFPELANWPFAGDGDRYEKLTTLGVFVENYKRRFKIRMIVQMQSPLMRLLGIAGVNMILLKMLWEHHSTASAMSRASQQCWATMLFAADTWDITDSFFGGCEVPREENNYTTGISPVVLVTPVRDVEPITYTKQVKNLYTMCLSIYNFGEFIQNIQLHHIPFLTTHVLALIVPEMRRLTVLGIYNCQLINLFDGYELLEIIQRDRPRGCENQVYLDFYPTYHVGPSQIYQAGNRKGERKVGLNLSYGVSWDDTGMYVQDTRIAIWQEVGTLLKQARSQGIDMESKHTMFRQWLDKSPCLAVEKTLKILMDPESEIENVIAHVAYGEFAGCVDKFNKSVPGKVPNKPEGSQWMKQLFKCDHCDAVLLGVYFSYAMIRNFKMSDQDTPTCMACKLAVYLSGESDHYKIEKRSIMKKWCWDYTIINEDTNIQGDWNTAYLKHFIDVYAQRTQGHHVREKARKLDAMRLRDEANQIFHETDEVQRPISQQALGRRGHYGIRAPTVNEKMAIEGKLLDKQWDAFRGDRVNGHGVPATYRG